MKLQCYVKSGFLSLSLKPRFKMLVNTDPDFFTRNDNLIEHASHKLSSDTLKEWNLLERQL